MKKLSIFLFYLLLLAFWQFYATYNSILATLFPPPFTLITTFLKEWPYLFRALCFTLSETLLGLLLAVIIGFALALLFNSLKNLKNLLMPPMVAWQAAPLLAIAPLIVLWFGLGYNAKVLMVMVVCFFPIMLATLQAIDKTPQEFIHQIVLDGAKNWQIMLLLKLPLALPAFFAGLKVATTYALGSAITAEWLGSTQGLGILLLQSRKTYNYPLLMVTVVLIIATSLALFQLVKFLEKSILTHFYLEDSLK